MLSPSVIRQIIRQSLHPLTASRHPLYSPSAETILLMAAAHESHLGTYLRQIGGGPARGIWQVEIATMTDNYTTFLNVQSRRPLAQQIAEITGIPGPDVLALQYNQIYCCVHARLKLYRSKGPIPSDLDGMAEYLKLVFNTVDRAATPGDYLDAYRELVG